LTELEKAEAVERSLRGPWVTCHHCKATVFLNDREGHTVTFSQDAQLGYVSFCPVVSVTTIKVF
jgi:hypothetical protein